MTGAGLASLIERMVTALNSREIPSAGSMLEFFNKEVICAMDSTMLYVFPNECVAASPPHIARY